jgi:hypothetical protein
MSDSDDGDDYPEPRNRVVSSVRCVLPPTNR